MIKIANPVGLSGVLMVEYRGNNDILLNSSKGHYVETLNLKNTYTLHDGTMENACFKLNVYNIELLIALHNGEVYEVKKARDKEYHIKLTETCIDGYRPFKCGNQFIISTTLFFNHQISQFDHRNEQFALTLIFKNTPEINNLFI